ncbi:MAG: bis(5'-nucleosyl)-tetraphosphatase (symmetrical) YqeK [Syntrophomonadaceae bacterium]|nr:bis(5'-nucleosyl)-tetraphosphatase (symmetrical) YqeK [Syntrophomonadaceae bacterium]
MSREKIICSVKERLTPARWKHSQGVAAAAVKLARRHQVDPDKAELAALLHDLARDLPPSTLLEIAESEGLISHPLERRQPKLLHAPVAAVLARRWGVDDPEVISAIAQHTLGAVGMSKLAKIIYLADLIEPGRDFPGVEQLRQLADEDLDEAMLAGFDQTVQYCLKRRQLLHPQTVNARNALLSGGSNNILK